MPKAGVGDQQAGDAEVGKLLQFIAVEIIGYNGVRHGKASFPGKKKTARLDNHVVFRVILTCFFGDCP